MRGLLVGALALTLTLGLGCREEGSAEKAGRKLDAAVARLRHPKEGPLEKLGRKADQAIEDVEQAFEEATKSD